MKRVLRIILIELAGLYIASQLAQGMVFQNAAEGILITSAALGVAMLIVKPVINLLLLPLSLATMGLFKFAGHVITLYIVDIALPQFTITGFHFVGLKSELIDLPSIDYDKGVVAYIAFSLIIWVVTALINWVRK